MTNPGVVPPSTGLVLSGNALNGIFANAESVSLLSYGSLDIYGTGSLGSVSSTGVAQLKELEIHAGELSGFNNGGGNVAFNAQDILLDNVADDSGALGPSVAGTLQFNAGKIELGSNQLNIDQFSTVELNATGGVMAVGDGGLTVAGALNITAPLITGAKSANSTITSGGMLTLAAPAKASAPTVTGGLAATLDFVSGAGIADSTDITLLSGNITLHATAGDVDLDQGANLDVTGESKTFFDITAYTNAGQVNLMADQGNVSVASGATIDVAAQSGGGNAGSLSISDPNPASTETLDGNLLAQGGAGGESGSFSLDTGEIPLDASNLPSISALETLLGNAGFGRSINIEVQSGSVLVDGNSTVNNFTLSDDDPNGAITVTGGINASGNTGGAISLQAAGSVVLESGALLTVAATNDNSAGQGGSVDLEAGSDINGVASSSAVVDIQTGSTINLSVANTDPALGDLAGTLHIRAPQLASETDLQVNPINGTIIGASNITVEGYQIFNTAGDNGSIDDQAGNVVADGNTFAGNTTAISSRLLANNAGLASILTVEPGAEIIDPSGDLTLANSWNLASVRFGPDNVAGDLTLRASGNVIFDFGASLNDGFTSATYNAKMLGAGTPWSYRITSGADFNAAAFTAVDPLSMFQSPQTGSVLIGQGFDGLTAVPADFQTIRTGVGSITITAGQDVQLLDTLATVYTAGTQAPAMADFSVPDTASPSSASSTYGFLPMTYVAQYSYEGGNVDISAQQNIEHLMLDPQSGQLIPDSST